MPLKWQLNLKLRKSLKDTILNMKIRMRRMHYCIGRLKHPNLIVMGNHDEWKEDHEEWEDLPKHQISYSFHLDEFFPLDFSCKVFNEATGAA